MRISWVLHHFNPLKASATDCDYFCFVYWNSISVFSRLTYMQTGQLLDSRKQGLVSGASKTLLFLWNFIPYYNYWNSGWLAWIGNIECHCHLSISNRYALNANGANALHGFISVQLRWQAGGKPKKCDLIGDRSKWIQTKHPWSDCSVVNIDDNISGMQTYQAYWNKWVHGRKIEERSYETDWNIIITIGLHLTVKFAKLH